ncbi:MAG: PilZ domain-containing protein [Thermoanaerobaculia bacterium]
MPTSLQADSTPPAQSPHANRGDRRRHPRRQIAGIQGTLRSPGDLTVLDISLTGLSAEAAGEIDPGQHCFLELVHQRHRVHIEAIVRWTSVTRVERRSDRFVPVFRAGLSFVDTDRDDSGGIWDWILTESEDRSLAAH